MLELHANDPLYDAKVAYYRRDLAPAARRVRVSICDNENTKLLFALLRLVEADHEDFELLIACATSSLYRSLRDARVAISASNEHKALQLLLQTCDGLLAKYPATLADDLDRLANGNVALFSNQRNALIQVKGEKEVLHFYRDYALTGLKMLQAQDMDDFDRMLNEVRLSKHVLLFHYCRGTLSRLLQDELRRGVRHSRSRLQQVDLSKPTIV